MVNHLSTFLSSLFIVFSKRARLSDSKYIYVVHFAHQFIVILWWSLLQVSTGAAVFLCSHQVNSFTPVLVCLHSHHVIFFLYHLFNIIMIASSADADVCPRRSPKTCNKCQGPMHGHVGPHGDLCRNPSRQFFLGDASELAGIQHDLEESIRVHQAADQQFNI